MAHKEIIRDENGEFAQVEAPDAIPVTDARTGKVTFEAPKISGGDLVAPSEARKLRRSTFRDEQGDDVYHDEIPVTLGVVYMREMPDELYRELVDLQDAFKVVVERAKADDETARALEKDASKAGEALALRQDALDAVKEVKVRNNQFTRRMITDCVAGWSHPRPYSPAMFRQLRGADQNNVLEAIVSASMIGREESDFLAPSSARS